MRRILASAMLVFILAGGVMTFIVSIASDAQAIHQRFGDCEGEFEEDVC